RPTAKSLLASGLLRGRGGLLRGGGSGLLRGGRSSLCRGSGLPGGRRLGSGGLGGGRRGATRGGGGRLRGSGAGGRGTRGGRGSRTSGGGAGGGGGLGRGHAGQLLGAADDILEAGACAEGGHVGLLDLHRLTGARVAGGPSCAGTLLEDAE